MNINVNGKVKIITKYHFLKSKSICETGKICGGKGNNGRKEKRNSIISISIAERSEQKKNDNISTAYTLRSKIYDEQNGFCVMFASYRP